MQLNELDSSKTYLFDETDSLKKAIRELSEIEVATLRKANKILYEYQYHLRRMREISNNFVDFQKTLSFYENTLSEKRDIAIDEDFMDLIFVDVNRTMNNFISSLKLFVEHLEKRLKSKYGEESVKFKNFKSLTRSLYHQYFSYRFLINLRDYGVHYNFPIDRITQLSDLGDSPGVYKVELFVEFSTEKLLKDKKFRSRLGADLRRYNNTFPVKFVMQEIMTPLQELFDGFMKIEGEYFFEQSEIVFLFAKENTRSVKSSFGQIVKTSLHGVKTDTITIPYSIAEKVKDRMKSLVRSSI